MKANEAPEKIILSADRETGILYDEWVTRDLTDNIKIEYIRKDAFIYDAVSWLKENADHYVGHYLNDDDTYMDESFIEDFRNYMEGE